MLLEKGKYEGRLVSQVLYEKAETGTLNLACQFDVSGYRLRYNFNLIQKDQTISTRVVSFLREALGWDGANFETLQESDYSGIPLEVVLGEEPSIKDPSKMFTVIKFVNIPGGNQLDMPQKADSRSLSAKYGSKFRAVSPPVIKPPSKPAQPAQNDQQELPAQQAPAKAGNPPRRPMAAKPADTVKTSTEAECWEKAQYLRATASENEQVEYFWGIVGKVCGDKTEGISPEEWGKVKDLLIKELPF